jgi:hypothetical protein
MYEINSYESRQNQGKNADYSLNPVKQKCVNFYVESQPISVDDLVKYSELMDNLPVGMQYGVRIRTWSQWHPDVQYTDVMVGYSLYGESGEVEEVLDTYSEFDVNSVPWLDLIS